MQLLFPNLDEEDVWDTYKSFHTPPEALEGCSEILETVKLLMGVSDGKNLKDEFVRILVWDTEEHELLLWEDETGAVHGNIEDFRIAGLLPNAPPEICEAS